jgi:hypothetical protein
VDRDLAAQLAPAVGAEPENEDNEQAVVMRDRLAEQMWEQYQACLAQRRRVPVVVDSESSGDDDE